MKNFALGFLLAAMLFGGYTTWADEKGGPSSEFVLDDFTIQWNVAKVGDTKLYLQQSTDTQPAIVLKGDPMMGDSLHLTPETAKAVGIALKKVSKLYRKLRGSGDHVIESVEAGECTVMFLQSPKTGFRVLVKPSQKLSPSETVVMERKAAILLAPHLLKAEAMASFLAVKVEAMLAD